jgi:AsmA-like C-terminal region
MSERPVFVKRNLKRLAVPVLILFGFLLLLFLFLQFLGPRIVNQESVKNRIQTAVSKELGGRLQYQKLGFALLPRPSLVIREPSFEIPGSISGSLQALYIEFEFLSLLTGHPRIADVRLDQPDFVFTLGRRTPPPVTPGAPSSDSRVAPVLGLLAARMPNLSVAIEQGRWAFVRDREALFTLEAMDGRVAFSPVGETSTSAGTAEIATPFKMVGSFRGTLVDQAKLIGSIRLRIDRFEADPVSIAFSGVGLEMRDTTVRGSGRIKDYLLESPSAELAGEGTVGPDTVQWAATVLSVGALPPGPVSFRIPNARLETGLVQFSDCDVKMMDSWLHLGGRIAKKGPQEPSADLRGEGTVGPDLMKWIWATASLPDEWAVRAPLSLRPVHLEWNRGGKTHLDGSLSVQQSVSITFDLEKTPDEMAVQTLRVQDQDSKAELAVQIRNRVLDLFFSGNLAPSTLDHIFEQKRFNFGWVKGEFQTRAFLDRPRESIARGRLEAERVLLPVKTRLPVLIDRVVVQASDRAIRVDPLVLTVGEVQNTVSGRIVAGAEEWQIDVSSDALKWDSISGFFPPEAKSSEQPSPEPNASPIRATIRAAAPSFTIAGWTASPARAEISIGPGPVRITVRKAVVCGIDLPGTITVPPNGLTIEINPSAHDQSLESTISCLGAEHQRATGTFDLSGTLRSSGSGLALVDSMGGTLSIDARDGRIMEDSITIRILTYLNVTDLLRGQFSNLGNEGVPYQSANFRASVEKGTLSFDEMVLKSPVVNLVGKGSIRLTDRTMDLTVLAAPFTSVDKMIEKIPLIRYIMAGTLVTIPIRVTGPIDRPNVKTMPPAAVADELGDLMGRVLKSPYKIIEPILPGDKGGR